MPRATIIGGGPAGSVAAILLARAGWAVKLVEQHRFPRDKVCGECVSALGLDVLRRNGLLSEIELLGPAVLRRAILHAHANRSIAFALPSPMWGVSRAAMDHALFNAARHSGANVLQPCRCEAIEPVVLARDLQTNRTCELEQDWILLADGKGALSPTRPMPTRDLGVKAHFANVDAPTDAIQLFGGRGHYGGVAPIENGLFNVALSIPASRVAAAGDLRRVVVDVLNDNPSMRRQFRSATMVEPILASPLPRFAVQDTWPARTIPLGNAASAIEPIGGEGMGLALRSAELSCDALIDAQAHRVEFDPRALQRRYRQLWARRARMCRLGGKIMSSPGASSVAIEMLSLNEPLLRGVLCLAGKSSG